MRTPSILKRLLGVIAFVIFSRLGFSIWYMVAADYSDPVLCGTYSFSGDTESSTLKINPDHSFQQELRRSGTIHQSIGKWRRVGQGGITFSKEFLVVSGQELSADGSAFGDMHKALGIFPTSVALRDYDIEWYGRTSPSHDDPICGAYAGDEEGVPASLTLYPNHTFEQAVSHAGMAMHAQGNWDVGKNGDIVFSKAFIKTTGETLRENETASSWNPRGSNLQIQIQASSKTGIPVFRKRGFPWKF